MQCVARKPNLASGRLVLPRNALTCMDRSLSARGKGRVGDMGPFLSPTLRVTGEPRFRFTRRHRPKGRRSITSSTTVLNGPQFGPITKRDLHYVTPTSEPPPAIKRSRRRIGDGPQIKGPLPGVSGDGCVGVLTAVRRSFISCVRDTEIEVEPGRSLPPCNRRGEAARPPEGPSRLLFPS